ncbi:MAG: amidohydrolase [Saprospiraceae bacterium]
MLLKTIKSISFFVLITILLQCAENKSTGDKKQTADLVILNGNVTTMDKANPKAKAIAIKDHHIIAVGNDDEIKSFSGENTKTIDAKGNFVMPGFIEGHGHYVGLGESMINLNLLNTKNWQEILDKVAEKAKTAKPGDWIMGRGWHQEKWDQPLAQQIEGYPLHDELSALTPNNPVLLSHASGHASFANAKAMEMVGINKETPDPSGGAIIRDQRGNPIGVFEERAEDALWSAWGEFYNKLSPEEQKANWLEKIRAAEKECLSKGITSFQDAGLKFQDLKWLRELAEAEELNVRLWVMIRHSYEEMKGKLDNYPWLDLGDHFLSVKAIKTEVDGALGSRGAWLLEAYHDKPGFHGQNTTTIEEVKNIASLANQYNLQLCVHAIGDRANREVLDIFEKNFKAKPDKKDWRWRIEHAQHLNPEDIPRFKELNVIASMQGIHCTSDAPFVVERLGEERARDGAYAWRALLDEGVVIANGTDAPVEDVSPIASYYASVTRKRADSGMEFFTEQAMTREEALYSYTLGNAYAGFEEKDKGSLEVGKLGDVVILSEDLLTCEDGKILGTEVLWTIVGGEVKVGE